MARRRITEALQALAFFTGLAGVCAGQSPRPCDPQAPLGPSHDLYCIDLIAAPAARGASGRVELSPPAGPFTIGVTPAGVSRYTLVGSVSGLAPGPTYVAWVMTPQMDTVIKLGPIVGGRFVGRDIALNKFTVLITAETNPRARTPGPRLILRGQSPSTRLFPPDQLTFAAGAAATPAAHEHEAHDGWPMVPMPANLTMLPAEMALRPGVSPYPLPSDSLGPAGPSERRHLAHGDTLWLAAAAVREGFAFNGQQPGPLIEVSRGSEIVVVLTNHLPDSTAIHWHGIRLDNRSDGAPGLTQAAIPSGGSFTYHIRFPDAGLYWYHAHVREDIQQDLGLYGNILVRAGGGRRAPVNREQVLMLDDVLVAEGGGQIPPGREAPTHALMGRFGNVFLVNGRPDYQLEVRRGEVVRFYFTNASNARTLNLSFTGAQLKLVAADAGPFDTARPVESVVIAPAERYVVDVRFNRAGRVALVNKVQGLDHLYGKFYPEIDTLGVVEVAPGTVAPSYGRAFTANTRDSLAARELEPYRRFLEQPPAKTLVLTLATKNLPFVTERLMQLDSIFFQPVEWSGSMPMMNWAATGQQVSWILRDPESGRENMDIDWRLARGQPVKLRLVNERRAFHGMQHPIHLHGQRFLVLAVNGVPMRDLAWKDTVLVPAGSTVDILFDTSNPGHWMLHCHIAEHLSAGMMMHLSVD